MTTSRDDAALKAVAPFYRQRQVSFHVSVDNTRPLTETRLPMHQILGNYLYVYKHLCNVCVHHRKCNADIEYSSRRAAHTARASP
jgi:hypothetical protein